MRGRTLMIAMLVFAALFGAVLWYFQTYAFYGEIGAESVEIAGKEYPVRDYRGIDAVTSPLKHRACYLVSDNIDAPPAENATPLVAPGWFDCFDAEAIAKALEGGVAQAYLAQENEVDGFDRIVAVYPDGRAYEWRQLSEKN